MTNGLKAALVAVFIAGGLLVLRIQMAPTIAGWAAANQPLTLGQRILTGLVHGSLWLAVLVVALGLILVLRSRPDDRR